jgi:hypothetical protein
MKQKISGFHGGVMLMYILFLDISETPVIQPTSTWCHYPVTGFTYIKQDWKCVLFRVQ